MPLTFWNQNFPHLWLNANQRRYNRPNHGKRWWGEAPDEPQRAACGEHRPKSVLIRPSVVENIFQNLCPFVFIRG